MVDWTQQIVTAGIILGIVGGALVGRFVDVNGITLLTGVAYGAFIGLIVGIIIYRIGFYEESKSDGTRRSS